MPNFLIKKSVKRRAWKTINVISTLAIVLNTGMIGFAIQPSTANAANPSASLDQCANDQAPSPNTNGCATAANDWVSGNVNESKSVYLEGDSVPYRLLLDNLTLGSHDVIIEWDTTKAGKHALDYITTFNRTVADANPCLGVSGCGAATTFPIPVDPQVSGGGVTPVAGNFTLYGGTITGVSAYSYADGAGFVGDKSARITVTFTATQANPVLAWGGHIATRTDWGNENSAVAISGSPYHTRLIDLDGSGGNQDRSLAAAAVIYPGSVTVIKDATPEGAQSFGYTTNLGSAFNLMDDGTATNTKVFTGITDFTDDNTGPAAYTVTEDVTAGWSLNNIVCTDPTTNSTGNVGSRTATIEMVEGENISCTFSNSADVGSITVNKKVDSDGDGIFEGHNAEANVLGFDWGLDAETPARDMGTSASGIATGTYSVTEDSVANYHVVGWYPSGDTQYSCTNPKETDATASVNVTKNGTASVTFCNAINEGSLTVIKHVVGSQEPVSSWTMNVAGTTPLSFPGNENGTTNSVIAGAYTVSETGPANYTLAYSGDCDQNGNVTVGNGQSKTCTLTNTRDTGTIKVLKNVDTDGDGDIDVQGATNWSWDILNGDQNIATGTTKTVATGTYTINEDQKTDYHVVSLVCDGQSKGATESTQVTVGAGQDVVCTFKNARDTGDLRIKKYNDLNGNGGWDFNNNEPYLVGWDFTVSQNGQTVATGTTGQDNVSQFLYIDNLPTGTYDVTETLKPNWVNTDPGTTPATKQVTITKNQQESLWFGNFELGRIWGYKYDTLGNKLAGWEICLDATTCTTTDANGMYEFTGLSVGTYTVAETLQGGWWAITPSLLGYIVPVVSGTDEQRDFTNFDGVNVKVNKFMDADGSLQTGNDQTAKSGWTVELWKDGNLFDTQVTDQNGSYTWTNLGPADYTVKEIFDANVYQALTPTQFSFTAVSGQDKEYTFVNFKTPKLTVIKHVINDNGGTAVADDFTMNVSGNNVSDASFPGNETGTTVTLNAGAYSVDESAFPGYAKTLGANCSGMVYSGDEVTCTITNDDIQPKLTIIKQIVNDNGGNAVISDFDLFVNATQVVSGATNGFNVGNYIVSEATVTQPGYTGTITGDCDAQGNVSLALADDKTCTITNDDQPSTITLVKSVTNDNGGNALPNDFLLTIGGAATLSGVAMPVQANTPYALNETLVPGYSFVSLTGDAKCPRSLGDTVTVDEGEHITCTITNDDEAPTITLVKNVINDNGGNAQPNDFQLTIGGAATLSGVAKTVNANQAYALNETQLTGYDFVSLTGNAKCPAVLGGTATLDEGEDITCTITNDDQAPSITLVKNVITDNGGTAQPNDFQLTIGGTAALSGVTYPVDANTTYALNETQVFGYDFVSLTGDQKCPAVLGGTVTLDEGEDITCTITNNDIQPKLTVTKVVVNDNGGTKVIADFPLFVDQTGVTSGVQNGFNAGSYLVSETTDPGYAATITGDCDSQGNVSLAVGEVKACTITNDDIQPKLTVTKVVINDNGGTAVVADFPLFVDQTSVSSGVQNGFDADSYVISETNLTGYDATISGDCDQNGNITLQPGDVKSCTITNDDVAPKLKLIKTVINDNGGTKVVADFPLFVDQTGVTSGQWNTLTAGVQYTASETTDPGYQASVWGGDCAADGIITLNVGDQKVCTITNDDIQPKLVVTKHVINDNLGTAVAGDFTLNVTGTNATPASFAGNENGTNVALDAGAYSVDENFFFGYAKTLGQDCSGTINVGETKYCTITNDDIPGRVTGYKFEDVNRNGTWDGTENGLANWTFYLRTGSETGPIAYTTTSDANGYFEFTGVNVGTYYLTEEVKTKWDQITPSNPGYFVVTVTPGYDTLAQCEQELSLVRVNFNPQCGYIFGNAERVNLHLDKWNDQEVAHGGDGILQTTETINYHIDWSVSGNSIATNVVLTDVIPTQLNLNVASISNGGTWDAATRTITWNFGTQQPNASGFVTYSATVVVPIANGTEIVNVARISADNSDPTFLEDNSTVKVASAPLLQITKTVSASIVNPGDPVTYTVKVKNIGTDTAINTIMTDTLPAGFSFVSTSPTAASIVGQTGTWNLGNLAVGDEKTITYTVNVAPSVTAGTYDNLAKAKADNASEVSTKVSVEVRVPQVLGEKTSPVLEITKAVSKNSVAPGDVITYTVNVKNTGTGSAINVVLQDILPVGFTFEGTDNTTQSWNLGDIAVGETKMVSYKVKVGSSVPNGSYENLAVAQADNHGKVSATVPVTVKRGRVLAEVIDTGAGMLDYGIAAAGLGLIVLGFVLTRRKTGNEIA